MGLDMFLYRQRYFSDFNPKDTAVAKAIEKIAGMRPTYLKQEVFTWRKANQIRGWFERTLGSDDRGYCTGRVTLEQLRDLRDTIETVLASTTLVPAVIENGTVLQNGKMVPNLQAGQRLEDDTVAKRLLPTTDGFFFGHTQYHHWYWQDLQDTKDALIKIIADHEKLAVDGQTIGYIYDESW